MLNKRRKRFRDITEARPSQFPYGYVYKGSTVPYQSQYLITPPYPVRPEDGLIVSVTVSVRMSDSAYNLNESIDLIGNVTGGSLGTTFIPRDYTYRPDTGEDHEGADIFGDVTGGSLGTTFFPVDYSFAESIDVAGDVISGVLGAEPIYVDYLNWPNEGVTVVGDVSSGTLS